MSADTRTPHTDALDSLGFIHTKQEKRDAIHLAVYPAVASEYLRIGSAVSLDQNGQAYGVDLGKGLGIVDPFLTNGVEPGEAFWLVVYPRQITSLRHVWEHPGFPASGETEAAPTENGAMPPKYPKRAVKESERWLENFILGADCPDYDTVIKAAIRHAQGGGESWDNYYLHFQDMDAHGEIPDEFWHHLSVVTGIEVKVKARYFSCSC